ncbi:metalloprotease [Blastocladiella emersonii ATCC 22665]|nr:metalloprotease [Blastocladiella emersonii ATCC 22665]
MEHPKDHPQPATGPGYRVLADHDAIRRPELDRCQYRRIALAANGLEVLLVSDPAGEMAAAALDVNVGHYQDPADLPGLAHFLEHLLFLGTEKYPKENSYAEYLAAHGGSSNAYTGNSNTNYYFECQAAHLEGALDRFAQFFIAPLFTPSCTDRELNAVDSEHSKNRLSDMWRVHQLHATVCGAGSHPYAKFGTGNRETLGTLPAARGVDARDELIQFHARYYSANIMRLVITGREPLDVLAQWAVEYFSPIANRSVPVPGDAIRDHPWAVSPTPTPRSIIRMKTVKDSKALVLRWAFPPTEMHWRANPASYLSHLIGHEGHGSILSELKQRGWVTSLSAGPQFSGLHFDFFKVSMQLTDAGLAHVDDILLAVFQYLARLRSYLPDLPKWIFDEIKAMADLTFRFQEMARASSRASWLARCMHEPYTPEWTLGGSAVFLEWRPDLIAACLAALTTDVEVTLTAPAFPDNPDLDQRDPWYGTEYRVDALPAPLLTQLAECAPHPALTLPEPNPFIPTRELTVERHDRMQAVPRVARASQHARHWVQLDDEFWVPRASLLVRFKNPVTRTSPRAGVMTELLADYILDELLEFGYAASLAGLQYSVTTSGANGLALFISGFWDKMPVLLDRILVAWVDHARLDDPTFDRLHRDRIRKYNNMKHDQPYMHALFDMQTALEVPVWSPAERLAALRDVSRADLAEFAGEIRRQMFVESFLYGNVDEDVYLGWMDALVARVATATGSAADPWLPLSPQQREARRAVQIRPGNWTRVLPGPDPENANSAVIWYAQLGPATDARTRALAEILVHATREPAFNTLRTQRQLGYIVSADATQQAGVLGYRVLVQSERAPAFVDACVEQFLADVVAPIVDRLDDAQLAKFVGIVESDLLERPKTLARKAYRVWAAINRETLDFDRDAETVAAAKGLTVDDVRAFYRTAIAPESETRRKLAMHVIGATAAKGGEEKFKDGEAMPTVVPALPATPVDDLPAWRAAQAVYPPLVLKL